MVPQEAGDFPGSAPRTEDRGIIDRYEAELRKAAKELDRRAAGMAAFEQELTAARQEIRTMQASTFWRLTAPLRWFVDLLKCRGRARR